MKMSKNVTRVNARGEEFGEIKREREVEDRMEERDS